MFGKSTPLYDASSNLFDVKIPLDVPLASQKQYKENMLRVTAGTGRLMLFAGDQKVEHLNDDFCGENISEEDNSPEHMFRIASKARIGAFATQVGLIAQYGMDYRDIPYVIKINSKTNLIPTAQRDPDSTMWLDPYQIHEFKERSGLNIVGIGYTVYLGSELEADRLRGARLLIDEAHKWGMLAIVWMYPRGKAVKEEKNPHLIAGAAGVAAALGADFVKVNYPSAAYSRGGHAGQVLNRAELLKEAVTAAGRTKLICAGGSKEDVPTFLKTLHDQIHISGTSGNATGRNIHQRPLDEAIRFANAVSAITFDNATVEKALTIYNDKS